MRDYLYSYLNDIRIDKVMNIDLIMSGGAWNGSYLYGSLLVLKALEEEGKVKINRISSCSISAILALLYHIDKIELYNDLYNRILDIYKTRCYFTNIDDILLIVREHITEEIVKSISGKIYITYFDVILCKQIVVNKYKSVDELLEIIKMSCHVPYVTDRKLVYNDRYIDGFYPYILHKKRKIRRIYINIFNEDKILDAINIKNEYFHETRIIEGMVQMQRFLIRGRKTTMCSDINEWDIIDNVRYNIIKMLSFLICYIIYFILWIKRVLHIKESSKIIKYGYKFGYKLYKKILKTYLV
jgi:hypothetical protein